MSADHQDRQCKKILSGIKKFLTLLNQDLIENILETNTNVDNKNALDLLGRLDRSIDQYLKRDGNLFYVGFLGHFSSGKSSTINSILNLKDSKTKRKVSINPTDEQITLITNSVNTNQIVKLIRVGSVPVVLSPIDENDFLKDKIIMDTPGSGDPSLIEEIVRDSLPLCDLIIYCISAASPLDRSDLPLLQEKERNLSKIPTIYTITRGDEFKKDRLRPLSEENYDLINANLALAELASRMQQVLGSSDINYEEFIVIDNIESFNISKLVKEISLHADRTNEKNLVNLHDHKIDFFIRASNSIKTHFVTVVKDKLQTMEDFVAKAQSNISDYDKKTLIGSDKLINEWKSIDDKVKQVVDGSINENNRLLLTLTTPSVFHDIQVVSNFLEVNKRSSKTNHQTNSEEVRTQLNTRLYDLKEKFKEKIYSLIDDSEVLNKSDLLAFLNNANVSLLLAIKSPFEHKSQYDFLHSESLNYLNTNRYEFIKRAYDSLLNRTKNRNPLDTIQKNIDEAKAAMLSIFESYNEAVRIYRVAAFSSEAKNYIRKLGLSSKLDQLDSENFDTNESNLNAQEAIFKKYEEEVNVFKGQCEEIERLLESSKLEYPILMSHSKDLDIESMNRDFNESATADIVANIEKTTNRIKNLLLDRVDPINTELRRFNIERNNELNLLKKQRLKHYIVRYIPALLAVFFTIALFIWPHFLSMESNLSLGMQWTLGILSNIAFWALSTIFIKSTDKFPRNKLETMGRYRVNKKTVIAEILDREFYAIVGENLNQFRSDIQTDLIWKTNQDLEKIISLDFSSDLHLIHRRIVENERGLKLAIQKYSETLTRLKGVISDMFGNVKLNKEVLSSQSILIKNKSMDPSFNLLYKTSKDMGTAHSALSEIEFS